MDVCGFVLVLSRVLMVSRSPPAVPCKIDIARDLEHECTNPPPSPRLLVHELPCAARSRYFLRFCFSCFFCGRRVDCQLLRARPPQVLKYGALIVDALVEYKQPVFVYIPPHAELRGGAWVVVDSTVNANVMEM